MAYKTTMIRVVHQETGLHGQVPVTAFWAWKAKGWELADEADAALLVPPPPPQNPDVITRDELEPWLEFMLSSSKVAPVGPDGRVPQNKLPAHLDPSELSASYVRFVDTAGNPLPAGSVTEIRINTVTGEIDDIIFQEA